ncbi:MAG: hypothetical protein AABX89_06005 [Candidatus Thermoplasmatota archaeon]
MRWPLPLALFLLLSGCAAPDVQVVTETATITQTVTETISERVEVPVPVEPANEAPWLRLTAPSRVQAGDLASLVLEGGDNDGHVVVADLDLNADGTAEWRGFIPTTLQATWPMAGSFTVRASVSDGRTSRAVETYLEVAPPAVFAASGSYEVGASSEGCAAVSSLNPPGRMASSSWTVPLPAALGNGSFLVDFAAGDNRTFAGVAALFLTEDSELGRAAANGTRIEGTIPRGATAVRFASCGGIEVTVRFTATPVQEGWPHLLGS